MYNQLFIGLLNCFPLSLSYAFPQGTLSFSFFTFHFILSFFFFFFPFVSLYIYIYIDVLEKPLRMRWRVSGYRKGERERGDWYLKYKY